jgi:hypothetical protein
MNKGMSKARLEAFSDGVITIMVLEFNPAGKRKAIKPRSLYGTCRATHEWVTGIVFMPPKYFEV